MKFRDDRGLIYDPKDGVFLPGYTEESCSNKELPKDKEKIGRASCRERV